MRLYAALYRGAGDETIADCVLSLCHGCNRSRRRKDNPIDLVPGSCGAPIQIVFNKPVTLSGGNTATDNRGVAHVTLLHSGKTLTWAGLDLGGGLEGGFQVCGAGLTVAWLDFHQHVAVTTAG